MDLLQTSIINKVLIPVVSVAGLVGNVLALLVLSRGEEVHQMKKSFVR